jgi:hypothetical protein
MQEYLSKRKQDPRAYVWSRPSAPLSPAPVRSLAGVRTVLARGAFGPGSKGFAALTKRVPIDVNVVEKVLLDDKWVSSWAKKSADIVGQLVGEESFVPVGSSVGHLDIVQHVLNYLPVVLICNHIVCAASFLFPLTSSLTSVPRMI